MPSEVQHTIKLIEKQKSRRQSLMEEMKWLVKETQNKYKTKCKPCTLPASCPCQCKRVRSVFLALHYSPEDKRRKSRKGQDHNMSNNALDDHDESNNRTVYKDQGNNAVRTVEEERTVVISNSTGKHKRTTSLEQRIRSVEDDRSVERKRDKQSSQDEENEESQNIDYGIRDAKVNEILLDTLQTDASKMGTLQGDIHNLRKEMIDGYVSKTKHDFDKYVNEINENIADLDKSSVGIESDEHSDNESVDEGHKDNTKNKSDKSAKMNKSNPKKQTSVNQDSEKLSKNKKHKDYKNQNKEGGDGKQISKSADINNMVHSSQDRRDAKVKETSANNNKEDTKDDGTRSKNAGKVPTNKELNHANNSPNTESYNINDDSIIGKNNENSLESNEKSQSANRNQTLLEPSSEDENKTLKLTSDDNNVKKANSKNVKGPKKNKSNQNLDDDLRKQSEERTSPKEESGYKNIQDDNKLLKPTSDDISAKKTNSKTEKSPKKNKSNQNLDDTLSKNSDNKSDQKALPKSASASKKSDMKSGKKTVNIEKEDIQKSDILLQKDKTNVLQSEQNSKSLSNVSVNKVKNAKEKSKASSKEKQSKDEIIKNLDENLEKDKKDDSFEKSKKDATLKKSQDDLKSDKKKNKKNESSKKSKTSDKSNVTKDENADNMYENDGENKIIDKSINQTSKGNTDTKINSLKDSSVNQKSQDKSGSKRDNKNDTDERSEILRSKPQATWDTQGNLKSNSGDVQNIGNMENEKYFLEQMNNYMSKSGMAKSNDDNGQSILNDLVKSTMHASSKYLEYLKPFGELSEKQLDNSETSESLLDYLENNMPPIKTHSHGQEILKDMVQETLNASSRLLQQRAYDKKTYSYLNETECLPKRPLSHNTCAEGQDILKELISNTVEASKKFLQQRQAYDNKANSHNFSSGEIYGGDSCKKYNSSGYNEVNQFNNSKYNNENGNMYKMSSKNSYGEDILHSLARTTMDASSRFLRQRQEDAKYSVVPDIDSECNDDEYNISFSSKYGLGPNYLSNSKSAFDSYTPEQSITDFSTCVAFDASSKYLQEYSNKHEYMQFCDSFEMPQILTDYENYSQSALNDTPKMTKSDRERILRECVCPERDEDCDESPQFDMPAASPPPPSDNFPTMKFMTQVSFENNQQQKIDNVSVPQTSMNDKQNDCDSDAKSGNQEVPKMTQADRDRILRECGIDPDKSAKANEVSTKSSQINRPKESNYDGLSSKPSKPKYDDCLSSKPSATFPKPRQSNGNGCKSGKISKSERDRILSECVCAEKSNVGQYGLGADYLSKYRMPYETCNEAQSFLNDLTSATLGASSKYLHEGSKYGNNDCPSVDDDSEECGKTILDDLIKTTMEVSNKFLQHRSLENKRFVNCPGNIIPAAEELCSPNGGNQSSCNSISQDFKDAPEFNSQMKPEIFKYGISDNVDSILSSQNFSLSNPTNFQPNSEPTSPPSAFIQTTIDGQSNGNSSEIPNQSNNMFNGGFSVNHEISYGPGVFNVVGKLKSPGAGNNGSSDNKDSSVNLKAVASMPSPCGQQSNNLEGPVASNVPIDVPKEDKSQCPDYGLKELEDRIERAKIIYNTPPEEKPAQPDPEIKSQEMLNQKKSSICSDLKVTNHPSVEQTNREFAPPKKFSFSICDEKYKTTSYEPPKYGVNNTEKHPQRAVHTQTSQTNQRNDNDERSIVKPDDDISTSKPANATGERKNFYSTRYSPDNANFDITVDTYVDNVCDNQDVDFRSETSPLGRITIEVGMRPPEEKTN